MKKIVTTLALSAAALCATTINVNSGWNLVGAVGAITPAQIPCAQTVWTYESGAWKLYVNGSTDANNYGFTPLSNIQAGQGFWVNAGTSSCSIDFSNLAYVPTEGEMFLAYGLVFEEKKNTVEYTIPGNTASYDESAKTFTLTAVKNTTSDSRSGIMIGGFTTPQPLGLVEATLNLQTANTTSNSNRAQLSLAKIPLTHFDTAKGASGVELGAYGLTVWFVIDFSDGTYVELYSAPISLGSMVGKDITVKAFVEGKNIKYEFSGDYTGTHTIDTTQYFHNAMMVDIDGGIEYAELRSRVKVDSYATDTSVVTVSDVKVAPYIKEVSGVASSTASFSTLGNFAMIEGDEEPEYMMSQIVVK